MLFSRLIQAEVRDMVWRPDPVHIGAFQGIYDLAWDLSHDDNWSCAPATRTDFYMLANLVADMHLSMEQNNGDVKLQRNVNALSGIHRTINRILRHDVDALPDYAKNATNVLEAASFLLSSFINGAKID